MRDVATYGGWKLPASALGNLLMGLAALGAVAALVFFISQETAAGKASYGVLIIGIFPLGFGWLLLAQAVRRFREIAESGCFLRAGPEGLSLRLPGAARRSSLWLAYDMWEYNFGWDEVGSISLSLEWDYSRNLLIDARGGRLELEGVYFKEPARAILDNIREAAKPFQPPIAKTTL